MYQDLRKNRQILCFVIVILSVLVLTCSNQPKTKTENNKIPENPLKQIEARENYLKKILSRDGIWKDRDRKDKLNSYLIEIEKMRLVSLIPVIVKRINYYFYESHNENGMITLEDAYPVYRTLRGIGIPAVPFMMAELKKIHWQKLNVDEKDIRIGEFPDMKVMEKYSKIKESWGDKPEKQHLYIHLLRFIYGQGYYGHSLTIKRLELEIENTKNENAKKCLKQALDLPFLQDTNYPDSWDPKYSYIYNIKPEE